MLALEKIALGGLKAGQEEKKRKMKKIETVEDVRSAMDLSEKFRYMVWDYINNDMAELQRLDYEEISPAGIKYHDHYYSFFYTLENAESFINSLVDCENWYFSEKAKPVKELINRWSDAEYDSEEYNQLEDQINQESENIMKELENYLKQYENPDQITENESIENQLVNGLYESYYIDGGQVKQYHPAVAAYYETI